MAVPVPKGEDFGRRQRSRRTLVMAVVFVLYLVLGGLVFGQLEIYEKQRTVFRPAPAWRAVQAHLNLTEDNSTEASSAHLNLTEDNSTEASSAHLNLTEDNSTEASSAQTGASKQRPAAAEQGSRPVVSGSVAESESWSALKLAALADCDPAAAAQIESLLEAAAASDAASLDTAIRLCGQSGLEATIETVEVNWSFIDACFFCMTVITTIGYGHISPSSAAGQIFCIVYSLLGIPISGLLLAGLSDFFAGNLLNFYDSKWQQKWGDSRWSLAGFTALYLLVGFLLFVFAPAVAFTWLEGWSYREAVYYAFITLSTIGFGDFTAAIANDDAWTTVYKIFVMLWVLLGLGYWVLVLNFLQKALKSKEVVAGLRQTSKLIAKEAEEIRQALVDAGILHRDAVFVPEHSKTAVSLMMNMSSLLAGSPGGEAAAAPQRELRGVQAMGANLRSDSLLGALMASLPAGGAAPAAPAAQQAQTAQPLSENGTALTPLLAAAAEGREEGQESSV